MTLANKLQLSLLIVAALAYSAVEITANVLTLGLLNGNDEESMEEEAAD